MKQRRVWYLFLLPLLVPIVAVGIREWNNQGLKNYSVGGFRDITKGEQVAVKKLADIVGQGSERGKIRVLWDVFKPAVKSTSKRSEELWLYGAIYDQQNARVTQYIVSPRFTNINEVEATQYDNVENSAIQAIANNDGTFQDLVQYGAVLVRKGKANFVSGYGPKFQDE